MIEIFALGGFQLALGVFALLAKARVVRAISRTIPVFDSAPGKRLLSALVTVIAVLILLLGCFVISVGVLRLVSG